MRLLLLVPALLLAACGQAGDLYLPPAEPAPQEAAPPPSPQPIDTPVEPTAGKKKEQK